MFTVFAVYCFFGEGDMLDNILITLSALFSQYDLGGIIAAVLKIMLIDLVLSGDNAAVIGLAIRHLPPKQKKRAAVYGGMAAVLLRILFTMFAAVLMRVPYVSALGGIILIIITFKLLTGHDEREQHVSGTVNIWSAVGIIVVADLSMAFDNVLAVAGAAAGEPLLVMMGLLLSVPLLIWGSTFISRLMSRYPAILWAGGAILLHTALHMLINDTALGLYRYMQPWDGALAWGCAALLFIYGWRKMYKSA